MRQVTAADLVPGAEIESPTGNRYTVTGPPDLVNDNCPLTGGVSGMRLMGSVRSVTRPGWMLITPGNSAQPKQAQPAAVYTFKYSDMVLGARASAALGTIKTAESGGHCERCNEFNPYQSGTFTCWQCRQNPYR